MNNKTQISRQTITDRIFTIRGEQVMLDRDLAEMYQVEVKRLNEQVKRNIERFPKSFRFMLNNAEKNELVANCDRLKSIKHSTVNPYVFTEQGVAMLSAVLRSEIAVKVSIQIINAFVQMRRLIGQETIQQIRLYNIENKLLEHDQKFNKLFTALEQSELPQKGIFYDGQVFDAYHFISDLIRKANKSIILIDNYVDDSVLTIFCKRQTGVEAIIYTSKMNKQINLDIEKHNQQYPEIIIKTIKQAHDRFLIIDNKELYHIGASLKDLGKRWFGFSRMDTMVQEVVDKLR
ncbi:MAG: DNA-binding protein [Bacteroidales bacterium 36-12]|nr:MAG: DNA-binding protein [Bacteroidales bacterium 36-12]